MTVRSLAAALLGAVLLTTACGKKQPPPVVPTPTSSNTPAPPRDVPATPPTAQPTGTNGNQPVGANMTELRGSLAEQIHFDFDQAVISSADAARLDRKIAILRANPTLKIRIIGHCDERGSDSYNVALGMKRAGAAKDYMTRAGIDASRIEIASLGREAPVDNSGTEEGMAKNRRDEFEVTAGPTTWVSPS